jgi:hypothetical protein
MLGIWNWLIDPANSPAVGALGLIVGVVGFPLTLVQLWRTKRAAYAAKVAAENARVRMNSFNAMRECEHARSQARTVNDAIGREDWDDALVNYQQISVSLINLQQSNVRFDDEVVIDLTDGIQKIGNNCNVLERAIKTDPEKLSKGKQFAALRPIDNIIAKALFNLERLSS